MRRRTFLSTLPAGALMAGAAGAANAQVTPPGAGRPTEAAPAPSPPRPPDP